MKIAVAAMGNSVAGHFGHCENFIFFDTEDGKIISENSVGVAYPNPFVNEIYIPVSIKQSQDIEIALFDLAGRCVYRNMIFLNDGDRELVVSGNNLPSGIYVWRLNGESVHSYGRVVKK